MMSSKELRYAFPVTVGVLLDAVFFWKFQPYSAREHGHDLLPWYFLPLLALLTGLLLTRGIEGKKRWVPIAMLGGFFAANACLIIFDCSADPTNHNLWPLEFVIILLATSPAFIGAGLAGLLARRSARLP
jgi:hypothetical protein